MKTLLAAGVLALLFVPASLLLLSLARDPLPDPSIPY
jgi:hypothetical protein